MFSNVFFCLKKSPKPKDVQFAIMRFKEKHEIFTCGALEPTNVQHFRLKIFFDYPNSCRLIFSLQLLLDLGGWRSE